MEARSASPPDAVETPAFIVRPGAIAASRDELGRLCGLAGCRALYSLKALGLPDVLRLDRPHWQGSLLARSTRPCSYASAGPHAEVQVTSPGLRERDCAELAGHCDAISFNSLSQSARLGGYFSGVRKGLRINPQLSRQPSAMIPAARIRSWVSPSAILDGSRYFLPASPGYTSTTPARLTISLASSRRLSGCNVRFPHLG